MRPFYDDVEIEEGAWLGEWLRHEINNAVLLEKNDCHTCNATGRIPCAHIRRVIDYVHGR